MAQTEVKKKPGRPKSKVLKDKKVTLSFTDEEHKQLSMLAKKDERTLTNLITLRALSLISN